MLMLLAAAVAAAPCPVVPLNDAGRRAEAARVSAVTHRRVPSTFVDYVLASGPWRLVWATPEELERGVYFFHRTPRGGWRLVDTWGGVLAPGERQDGIRWAMAAPRRVPAALAACFADAVMAGH